MFSGVRLLLGFVASIVAMSVALPVWAAPPGPGALPVHVTAVKSDDALDQAEALTTALRKAVLNSDGWSLGDSEQSLEFLALKMKCSEPIDAACEGRIAEVLKADRFIWAVIAFDGADNSKVKGTVNFFVRGKGTQQHQLSYSANLTDPNADALISVAESALAAVTGGAPQGTLKVSAGGVAGQIFIDDKPLGALEASGGTYQLPAGEHRVVVKSPGYEDAEGTASLKPATTVELTLTLVPVAQEAPIDGRFYAGIGVMAVAVGAGVVGLWASLEVSSKNDSPEWTEFLEDVPQGTDACEAASTGSTGTGSVNNADGLIGICDDAATMEVLQAVMYPVAGVAAGVGLYLILTSDTLGGGSTDGADSALSSLKIVPIITPDVGAVSLSYSF